MTELVFSAPDLATLQADAVSLGFVDGSGVGPKGERIILGLFERQDVGAPAVSISDHGDVGGG